MRDARFAATRVLLLEDGAVMRNLLRSILENLGVGAVFEAESLADAIQIFERDEPDLALVDIELEDCSGIDFVRYVRHSKETRPSRMPVIVVSGHGTKRDVMEAIDAGAHEFMVKPISPKALCARIYHTMLRPRRFIESETYLGPDRRRRADPNFAGPERRVIIDDDSSLLI